MLLLEAASRIELHPKFYHYRMECSGIMISYSCNYVFGMHKQNGVPLQKILCHISPAIKSPRDMANKAPEIFWFVLEMHDIFCM